MLTQTVTITQNSTPNIIIGRRSTYETQQVIFDVSWLIQTYGEGTAELLIKRPKDASAYPVVATLDGNTLTWTVSDTDTQDKGHGECEIYWYVNGGLAKSCICGITILRDIGDTTETAPDPYETWVDELARLGAETLANAQAAEQSANDAAQSASEADNSAAAALKSEENALDSENAAKASEQAAAASAQGVEQSATAARQSATEAAQSASAAESSANDAQESADNASASADRAEQAEASIEGDTERAEAAAREAQGAASYASVFADTASAKATEAAGSAATAEQAASTATQEAADASASATAAAGSASSASASATAAGNAQSAAETAQGKAEDAQEAAETAAQSIEDSAAQIDENTADILNLKSAFTANLIHDTASGSIANFPDGAALPVRDLTVDIDPIQDLYGYDSPWPAGGGKNKCVFWQHGYIKEDGTIQAQSINGMSQEVRVANGQTIVFSAAAVGAGRGIAVYSGMGLSGLLYRSTAWTNINPNYLAYTATQDCFVVFWYNYNNSTIASQSIFDTAKLQIELASTPTAYSPYSNICPISGHTDADVTRTGKNLLDTSSFASGSYKDVILTKNADGSISLSGTASSTANINGTTFTLPAGTYTFSGSILNSQLYLYDQAANTVIVESANGTIRTVTTTEDKTAYLRLRVGGGSTVSGTVKPQLELGSSASAYEPYQGNTYTIQLGDTVYGGTLDVTSGKLTVNGVLFEATSDNLNGLSEGASSTDDWLVVLKSGAFPNTNNGKRAKSICSHAPYKFANVDGTTHFYITTNGFWLVVPKSAYPTFADFTNSLTGNNVLRCVAYIATPIVYDLTPTEVTTLLGTNNVWADTGDTTVDYYADPTIYINRKIAAAVAALS